MRLSALSLTVCTKPPKGENWKSFLWCFPEIQAHGGSHLCCSHTLMCIHRSSSLRWRVLTRCPSPGGRWCGASRPSSGHGWGAPPTPAAADPGFHSWYATGGGRDHLRFSRKHANAEIQWSDTGHGVTTEEQRARPVYPLCAGPSEDRLCINSHFPTPFHPVSQCCSPAQESKSNFASQAPQSTHHVTRSWWHLHTWVWPDLWLYILYFPFHLKSSLSLLLLSHFSRVRLCATP